MPLIVYLLTIKKAALRLFLLKISKVSHSVNNKKIKGFTLIELMIVFAIIGILTALALQTYQDYTISAKVTEGIVLAGSLRAVVADNAANATPDAVGGFFNSLTTNVSGALPAQFAAPGTCSLNGGDAAYPFTKAVESVIGTTSNGLVAIKYRSLIVADTGSVLLLYPSTNSGVLVSGIVPTASIIWICYTQGKLALYGQVVAIATLLKKHAPAKCR